MQILFLKAGPIKNRPGLHLQDYTDRTGKHNRHWVRGDEPPAKLRRPSMADDHGHGGGGAAAGFGTHNIQPGDGVSFEAQGVKGKGSVVTAGKDGATVRGEDGQKHEVYWHEISGHAPKPGQQKAPAPDSQVLGKQEPIEASKFVASDYAKSHDQADVDEDKILDQFPPDTRDKIGAAQERLKSIEQTIDQHRRDGKWDEARRKLHDQILKTGGIKYLDEDGHEQTSVGIFSDERIQAATPPAGQPPTMIILGGRGGSGKSSFKNTVYDPDKFIVLDADAIKQLMPEYEGWNAHQVHEESGEIFDKAVEKAGEMGLNVVLDKTMKTAKSAIADVGAFKDAGYRVEAHYMHLPRQEAAKRAVHRFINGGARGRYVPPKVVLSNTTNEDAFDQVKGMVDAWSFRDNNVARGQQPILISQSGEPAHAKTQQPTAAPGATAGEPIRKAHSGAMILMWR